jgi:hypothetical protein
LLCRQRLRPPSRYTSAPVVITTIGMATLITGVIITTAGTVVIMVGTIITMAVIAGTDEAADMGIVTRDFESD